MNNTFEEVWNKLKNLKIIAMSLHASPDGDSLGSCAALKYVLERDFGCKVVLVSKDQIDKALSEFTFAKEVDFGTDLADLELSKFEAIVLLDSSEPSRFSAHPEKFKDHFIINIDHHHTNNFFGKLNIVESKKPSCCSLLLEFFKKMNVRFDKELSERLLLGICTDSVFFSFEGISVMDAAFLIEQGADYKGLICNKLRMNIPLKIKKYHGHLINNLKSMGNYAYSTISFEEIKELGLNKAEERLGIAAIQDIAEFDFVFTLVQWEDGYKGSFRSRTNIDISEFAKRLKGGGHKAASGFYIEPMPMDEAVKKVISVIEEIGVVRY